MRIHNFLNTVVKCMLFTKRHKLFNVITASAFSFFFLLLNYYFLFIYVCNTYSSFCRKTFVITHNSIKLYKLIYIPLKYKLLHTFKTTVIRCFYCLLMYQLLLLQLIVYIKILFFFLNSARVCDLCIFYSFSFF